MSELDRALGRNEALLRALRDEGDDGTKPRPVIHVAYFASRGDVDRATELLQAAGFEVDVDRKRLQRRWVLEASRTEAVTPTRADAFTREAFQIVSAAAGEYDGWFTEVVD